MFFSINIYWIKLSIIEIARLNYYYLKINIICFTDYIYLTRFSLITVLVIWEKILKMLQTQIMSLVP